MRTKTRTTIDIKPGMVIRFDSSDREFRQVAAVTPGPWPNTRYITFVDGPGDWYHAKTEWAVARGKTTRNAVKARAAQPQPTGISAALQLLTGYAQATIGRRNTWAPTA